jgi:predicted LPLAT superfamily acyltransferase
VSAGPHWSSLAERGATWGLWFCAGACRLLGRRGASAVLVPAVLYFYLSGRAQRRASRDFLARAFRRAERRRDPGFLDRFRHFRRFTERALDSFLAWTARSEDVAVEFGDVAPLLAAARDRRGALLIVSHHGNVDVVRASLDDAMRRRLVVLVHTRHAENYNRFLARLRPEFALNMLQVTQLGPETAIQLRERVERGDWIVIAGDRTPVGGSANVARVPFLDAEAPFPVGPYVLAALLECPVMLLFCRRVGDRYRLDVEVFAERIELPRGQRGELLAAHARDYARRLEAQALADPFQSYNFFDFWAPTPKA